MSFEGKFLISQDTRQNWCSRIISVFFRSFSFIAGFHSIQCQRTSEKPGRMRYFYMLWWNCCSFSCLMTWTCSLNKVRIRDGWILAPWVFCLWNDSQTLPLVKWHILFCLQTKTKRLLTPRFFWINVSWLFGGSWLSIVVLFLDYDDSMEQWYEMNFSGLIDFLFVCFLHPAVYLCAGIMILVMGSSFHPNPYVLL